MNSWCSLYFKVLVLSAFALTGQGAAAQGLAPTGKQTAVSWIDVHEKHIVEMSDAIWGYAEPPFEEFQSSLLLIEELRKAGFAVQEHVATLPTAFIASFSHGSGKPVIGIVAEYDTPLATGLSQKAGVPYESPLVPGYYGHACGHNLIASASVAAAVAIKEAMVQGNISGTIKFFGTPAEEAVTGKVYMADAGVFNGLDAALAWHPGPNFEARYGVNNAMNRMKFVFRGKDPESALKAATNLQKLDAFGQGTITLRGSSAEINISVTQPTRQEVDRKLDEVRANARTAAAETGTEVQELFVVGVYNRLTNEHLVKLMDESLREFAGKVTYTPGEMDYARKIEATMTSKTDYVLPKVLPPSKDVGSLNDNGDVSWITPFISIRGGVYPKEAEHHWQATSMTNSSIAHKALPVMAKTLAVGGLKLMSQPDMLGAVRKEFEEKTRGFVYRAHLPEDRNWRWLRQ